MSAGSFADSNIVLYLAAHDPTKAAHIQELLEGNFTISVQVLNEVASVFRGKWDRSWAEADAFLRQLRESFDVVPLTVETHDLGIRIAQRYRLSIYDGMIVAAALLADCDALYSEDMHHGLVVESRLRIVNPFRET